MARRIFNLRTLVTIGATLGVLLVGGVATMVAGIYSGVYDIAAIRPHTQVMWDTLSLAQKRSVRLRAGETPPPLDDADLIRRGLELYRPNCVPCHGAPGEPRARMGVGVNPNPPPLETVARKWSASEIYWITKNGLKMAGMPAFGLGEEELDLWALTAFVVRMNTLGPEEYRRMVAALEGRLPPGEEVTWTAPDLGWDELERRGRVDRGRALIGELGCGTCHVVPGVRAATGKVGPPLVSWRRRHYISGRLVNGPRNLVRWLLDPPALEPGTAMPDVVATEEQAWDLARFLYTLE